MAEIKRPNYFTSQFLVEADFKDEQSYHLAMQRTHNRLLHSWGVMEGLQVTKSAAKVVAISPGKAIDNAGREIVLTADTPVTTVDLSAIAAGNTVYIILSYQEVEDPADHYTSGGVDNYTRITERPKLESVASPPSDGSSLQLAKVTMTGAGEVGSIDNTVRTSAASTFPTDLQLRSLTIINPALVNPQTAKLSLPSSGVLALTTSSLALDTDKQLTFASRGVVGTLDGKHKLSFNGTGNLMDFQEAGDVRFLTGAVPAEQLRITAAGNVGVGNATPTEKLDVIGNIRINDNNLYFRQPGTDTNHGVGWFGAGKAFGGVQPDGPVLFGFNAGALGTTNGGQKTVLNWYANGNVGIGPTVPDRSLTIGNATGANYINVKDGTREVLLGVDTTGAILSAMTNHDLVLRSGSNAEHMRIAANGNVGIGVNPPTSKLTIDGTIGFTNTTTTMMYMFQSGSGNPDRMVVAHSPNFGNWGLMYRDSDDSMIFESGGTPVLTIGLGNKSVRIDGPLTVTGAKSGYVVDHFISKHDDIVEEGDVVVISNTQTSLYHGHNSAIPVPEITIASHEYDTKVCGIVSEIYTELKAESAENKGDKTKTQPGGMIRKKGAKLQHVPSQAFTKEELGELDRTKVGPDQIGMMVTLGAYAHCKVDADIAPIEVGDLLTSSKTKGHAQKVTNPSKAVGAIIGKALASLKKGKGKIPVIVTLH